MSIEKRMMRALAGACAIAAASAGCDGGEGDSEGDVATIASALSSQPAAGFVWAHSATGTYNVDPSYSHNTAGGTNKVTQLGTGSYRVDFPGLHTEGGGNVQVTSFGTTGARCKVSSWGGAITTLRVFVLCFAPNGTPVNSQFSAAYMRRASSAAPAESGYVWADQPAAASYTPSLAYQWNSAGGNITISRGGVGIYYVKFPGQSFVGGTVQVTAYGTGNEICKVQQWSNVGADQRVPVFCFTPGGQMVDTRFTALLSKGSPNFTTGFGYALADQPSASSYTASYFYSKVMNSGPGGPVNIVRTAVGRYTVTFNGLQTPWVYPTSVQVTGFGPSGNTCQVASWWGQQAIAYVACHTLAGTPADAPYTVTMAAQVPIFE